MQTVPDSNIVSPTWQDCSPQGLDAVQASNISSQYTCPGKNCTMNSWTEGFLSEK